jgi:outer membrane protein assembly factor BamB
MLTMRHTTRIIGLAACLAVVSTTYAGFDGPAPVAWRWSEATSGAPGGAPLVEGDNVFVAVGGRLYSLDRKDGAQNWRFPAAEPLDGVFRNGCAFAGQAVVAANDKNQVYAVDKATGQMLWQYTASGPVIGPVVAVGSSVVFRVGANELIALNAADGSGTWTSAFAAGDISGTLAAWQSSLLYATSDGRLVSMDILTKKANWTARFTRLSANSGPVVFGDDVYVNTGQFVTAMRAQSGGAKWQKRLEEPLVFSPAPSDAGVVVTTASGKLFSFDLAGKPIYGKGVDLETSPVTQPAYVGDMVAVSTANGAMNLVNPFSGDVVFSYIIPPLVKGMTATAGGSGGAGAGAGDGDRGAAGSGGGAAAGGGGGGARQGTPVEVRFVQASGPASMGGTSLLVLARDGSLICFDKEHGVDLTPPEIELLWPNPGDQVAGKPPMELIFRILDGTSGVDPESVKVTIDGKEYIGAYKRDGFLSIRITPTGANPPLSDGRREIAVAAADWLGNAAVRKFALTVDNTLPALGSPRSTVTAPGAGGGGPTSGGTGGG